MLTPSLETSFEDIKGGGVLEPTSHAKAIVCPEGYKHREDYDSDPMCPGVCINSNSTVVKCSDETRCCEGNKAILYC
uniref:Uncharacterized protein n=1 Tax=Sphaerodactylus townsendi TaxID=933632 RepID=A0ACB8EJS4_9SAUR